VDLVQSAKAKFTLVTIFVTSRAPTVDLARWQKGESSLAGGMRIGHNERVLPMLGSRPDG
jgi:hypothetical protein